jgi:hypothetical protein
LVECREVLEEDEVPDVVLNISIRPNHETPTHLFSNLYKWP